MMDEPRLGGRYRILHSLGRGGMADVLLAEDLAAARRVAVKRTRAGAPCTLAREARITARLDHAGIVRVHDEVRERGCFHLVLPYLEGPTVAAAAPAIAADPEAVVRIAAGLSAALAHAHGRGVHHLDLKAENVVLDRGGVPTLIDFGIASCEGEPDISEDPGALIGTPRAMAPEQIRGEHVDGRADLFALGALLYELVTGASPFGAATVHETLRRVLVHSPTPVRWRAPAALPRRLAELIDHLLGKDPALRPQSAAEVAAHVAMI